MFSNLLGNASINFIIILCSLQPIKENLSQHEYTSAFSPDSCSISKLAQLFIVNE